MIKKLLFIVLIFLSTQNSFALEVKCDFEEVYMDGSYQQGIFFFNNNKLRYQYNDPQLYTLIYNNFELFAVQNNNNHIHQQVIDRNNVIQLLKNISSDHPNFKDRYNYNKKEVVVETDEKKNFIKRLAFKSDKLNLSIYFQNCQFNKIDQKLFSYKNFLNY
tara:strand:+ start:490 stop:972 length:483 start_codon:yes stop_codon:yes gene_type:complete